MLCAFRSEDKPDPRYTGGTTRFGVQPVPHRWRKEYQTGRTRICRRGSPLQVRPILVDMVMRNHEEAAIDAWRILAAASVFYFLEGGINNWLAAFGREEPEITPITSEHFEKVSLRCPFESAGGGRYECSDPNLHDFELGFEPKIKLELKRVNSGGGCG